MLLVVFHAGEERFGLEAGQIIEIVPLVRLGPVQHAPAWVAGLFNYRGSVAPVIDVSMMLKGEPARNLLSTRILLVNYPGRRGESHVLGLLAERVLETIACSPDDFQTSGIATPDAPYLGGVLVDGGRMLRRITLAELLPPEVQELLFNSRGRAG